MQIAGFVSAPPPPSLPSAGPTGGAAPAAASAGAFASPPPPTALPGLDTEAGRAIATERVAALRQLATEQRARAQQQGPTGDAWRLYMDARAALQTERTRTEQAPQRLPVPPDPWPSQQLGRIDDALRATAPPAPGPRDPDLIQPGESVVLAYHPAEPRIVTPTEARQAVVQAVDQRVPGIARQDAGINDPLRPLAAQDPLKAALALVRRDHAGDATWQHALDQAEPAARLAYTTEAVAGAVQAGRPAEARRILATQLDATEGPEERAALFEQAGRPNFDPQAARRALDAAIAADAPADIDHHLIAAGQARHPDHLEDWFSRYAEGAPPELAQPLVADVLARVQAPDSRLSLLLTGDLRGPGGGDLMIGLSDLVQRADAHGGQAAADLARAYEPLMADYVSPQYGLEAAVGRAVENGNASLASRLLAADLPEPARLSLETGYAQGLKSLEARVRVHAGEYTADDKEALALQSGYAPMFGSRRTAAAVAEDRTAHPALAVRGDRAYTAMQDDAVVLQRVLDSLGTLPAGRLAAVPGAEKVLADLGAANGPATMAMGSALGSNAALRPGDAAWAPLADRLRGDIVFGNSADVQARGPEATGAVAAGLLAASAGTPNTARTNLQIVGNQGSVYRHVIGLYGISGESMLSGRGFGWLMRARGAPADTPAKAGSQVSAFLDRVDQPRLERLSRWLTADAGQATEQLRAMQLHLPALAAAWKSRDAAAIAREGTRLSQALPNLGVGSENRDPSLGVSAPTLRGLRVFCAAGSAVNNGVNGSGAGERAQFLTDPADRAQARRDEISSDAFAITLGAIAGDGLPKTVRQFAGGSTDGFIQRAIDEATRNNALGAPVVDRIRESRAFATEASVRALAVGDELPPALAGRMVHLDLFNSTDRQRLQQPAPRLTRSMHDQLSAMGALSDADLAAMTEHARRGTPLAADVGSRLGKTGLLGATDLQQLSRSGTMFSPRAGGVLKEAASWLPGEANSVAGFYWTYIEFKAYQREKALTGQGDLTPTLITAGVSAADVTGMAGMTAKYVAQRAAQQSMIRGALLAGGRYAVLGEAAASFAGPVAAAGNIIGNGAYFLYGYQRSKSMFEADRNPRFQAMVQQTTQLDGTRAAGLMDQSGGAWDSPSPMKLTIAGRTVPWGGDRIAARIANGGVQPVEVLLQWSAQRGAAYQGSVQAYVAKLSPAQMAQLSRVTADIAEHDIPRGQSQITPAGMERLTAALKSPELAKPELFAPRAVDDLPAPAAPQAPPEATGQAEIHTVRPGDTLWDLYGGRQGLDRAWRDGRLTLFDPAAEDGRF